MLVHEVKCVFSSCCYYFSLKLRNLVWTCYSRIHFLYSFSRFVWLIVQAIYGQKIESPLLYKQIHKKWISLVLSLALIWVECLWTWVHCLAKWNYLFTGHVRRGNWKIRRLKWYSQTEFAEDVLSFILFSYK
jgi:hypothetical protein